MQMLLDSDMMDLQEYNSRIQIILQRAKDEQQVSCACTEDNKTKTALNILQFILFGALPGIVQEERWQ
jgi:hypothetical protein